MMLIAGLGNPGLKYRHTRHNAGFEAIDAIAEYYGISLRTDKFRGKAGKGIIEGEKVILVKPQTFMNDSGQCIKPLLDYFELDPTRDLLVISDDVMLEPGRVRIRRKGSAGGHNGLKSIIKETGTEDFTRLRIGVGKFEDGMDMVNYVLGHPGRADRKKIERVYESIPDIISLLARRDVDGAMNSYNSFEF